jgi:fructose-1,6-bisphosphatase/inositol monophosphatase family enzyme
MLPDPDRVTEILAEAAAEEILPRFRDLESHEISEKESGELVTVADVAAERHISRRLLDLLPGSMVVGEEAVAEDPAVMDALQSEAPVWVIDPIDGTGNFAAGRNVFAVMAALVRNGQILGAWIHDPLRRRTGVAQVGEGAFLDGWRLRAAKGTPIDELTGTLHAGMFSTPEMNKLIQARREDVHTVKSLRCAGQEYLRLAAGQLHFSLFTKLMPWDHATGVLIHREAGGLERPLAGKAYDPARRGAPALLIAPDEASWQALFQSLFGGTRFADLAG